MDPCDTEASLPSGPALARETQVSSTLDPSPRRSTSRATSSTRVTSARSEATPTQKPVIFTTIEQLFNDLDNVSGDSFCVERVSPSTFASLQKERDRRRRHFRFGYNLTGTESLFIAVPTSYHERCHSVVYQKVSTRISSQGLEDNWIPMGATTFYTDNRTSSKESDSSGGPWPQREASESWPTLVVEAGYSESFHHLRNSMRWWFSASNHQVKIVVLVKLFVQTLQIIIEKWQEVPALPQSTRTTRATSRMLSASNNLVPDLQQEITISRTGPDPRNHLSYNVTRGALRLSFELLFLRALGPGESDVVLGIEDLQKIARQVWC